jgi:hypothetical protein
MYILLYSFTLTSVHIYPMLVKRRHCPLFVNTRLRIAGSHKVTKTQVCFCLKKIKGQTEQVFHLAKSLCMHMQGSLCSFHLKNTAYASIRLLNSIGSLDQVPALLNSEAIPSCHLVVLASHSVLSCGVLRSSGFPPLLINLTRFGLLGVKQVHTSNNYSCGRIALITHQGCL